MFKAILRMLVPSLAPGIGRKYGIDPITASLGSAAIGAVGSIFGDKSSSQSAQQQQADVNSPWSKAQPYITQGYDKAQGFLNDATTGAYTGPRVAGLNPYTTQGADSTAAFAGNQGQNIANGLYGSGSSMLGFGQQFGNNAQSVFDQAGTDQTQNFLKSANDYANSPYADSMIDAASRDTVRNLNENQLPALNLAAAGSGNTNSTRTGVAQGIAERGASDRLADISSSIRSNLFNTGLSTAQSQYNTQQALRSNVNQQLGTAYGQGVGSLTAAQQANGNNFDQLTGAGNIYQTNDQANLDANKAAYTEGQNTNLDLLQKYMSIINGKYGGTGVAGQVSSPVSSGIQGALGGAASGAGIIGKLGGFGNAGTTGLEGGYNNVTGDNAFDNKDLYG
jgi:hypothetical protein